MQPVAESHQYTRGGTYTQGFVADSIGVKVHAGGDTALILSTTIVIDMLNEVRAASQRASEARRREEETTGHRRRRGNSDSDRRRKLDAAIAPYGY